MGDVIDRDGFRANVGIVLISEDGKLFTGAPGRRPRLAVSPGRHAPGESAEQSLYRELHEEIGLAPAM